MPFFTDYIPENFSWVAKWILAQGPLLNTHLRTDGTKVELEVEHHQTSMAYADSPTSRPPTTETSDSILHKTFLTFKSALCVHHNDSRAGSGTLMGLN